MNNFLSPCALHRMKCSKSVLQNPFWGIKTGKTSGFTLAEMMVVMLILSIVLAAMAPVMTTRNKTDQSSPWRYSEGNLSDAYYGLGESQTAMIGQREYTNTDEAAKLIINSSASRPDQIAFKRNDTNIGVLRMVNNGVMLGSMNAGGSLGTAAVSLGTDTKPDGLDSVAVGRSSKSTASYSVAVGNLANASATETVAIGDAAIASGNGSLALGAMSQATGANAVAVGIGDDSISISGPQAVGIGYQATATHTNTTAVGYQAKATGTNSVAIGPFPTATGDYSVAIGEAAEASGTSSSAFGDYTIASGTYATAVGVNALASSDNATALGYNSKSQGSNSIAIGNGSSTEVSNAIVMGTNATVLRGGGIAIGNNAYSGATNSTMYGDNAVAIGSGAKMGNDYGVALGNNSGHTNKGTYGVAIGYNACQYASGSNKVCIGANSGPKSGSNWATDDTERIFIGSKSKFNDGAAVLEVHNNSGRIWDGNGKFVTADSTVVINGHLVVKGGIVSTLWRKGESNDDINLYGRTGGQLEPFDASGIISRYGPDDKGAFRGFNGNKFNTGSWGWSDKRLKYVGTENTSGLDKIRQLKVFNYTFKKDEAKTPRVGVIAQDLQKIFPDAVKKGADGFLNIRMEDIFFAVVNAIKELDARVTALEKENNELKQAVKQVQNENKKLEARLNAIDAKLK